jgi:excisionase family DNA binding protein
MVTTAEEAAFLTVRELASLLRVSRTKAYQLVAAGEVPSVRVGGQVRIPREDLDRHLAQSMRRPAV